MNYRTRPHINPWVLTALVAFFLGVIMIALTPSACADEGERDNSPDRPGGTTFYKEFNFDGDPYYLKALESTPFLDHKDPRHWMYFDKCPGLYHEEVWGVAPNYYGCNPPDKHGHIHPDGSHKEPPPKTANVDESPTLTLLLLTGILAWARFVITI